MLPNLAGLSLQPARVEATVGAVVDEMLAGVVEELSTDGKCRYQPYKPREYRAGAFDNDDGGRQALRQKINDAINRTLDLHPDPALIDQFMMFLRGLWDPSAVQSWVNVVNNFYKRVLQPMGHAFARQQLLPRLEANPETLLETVLSLLKCKWIPALNMQIQHNSVRPRHYVSRGYREAFKKLVEDSLIPGVSSTMFAKEMQSLEQLMMNADSVGDAEAGFVDFLFTNYFGKVLSEDKARVALLGKEEFKGEDFVELIHAWTKALRRQGPLQDVCFSTEPCAAAFEVDIAEMMATGAKEKSVTLPMCQKLKVQKYDNNYRVKGHPQWKNRKDGETADNDWLFIAHNIGQKETIDAKRPSDFLKLKGAVKYSTEEEGIALVDKSVFEDKTQGGWKVYMTWTGTFETDLDLKNFKCTRTGNGVPPTPIEFTEEFTRMLKCAFRVAHDDLRKEYQKFIEKDRKAKIKAAKKAAKTKASADGALDFDLAGATGAHLSGTRFFDQFAAHLQRAPHAELQPVSPTEVIYWFVHGVTSSAVRIHDGLRLARNVPEDGSVQERAQGWKRVLQTLLGYDYIAARKRLKDETTQLEAETKVEDWLGKSGEINGKSVTLARAAEEIAKLELALAKEGHTESEDPEKADRTWKLHNPDLKPRAWWRKSGRRTPTGFWTDAEEMDRSKARLDELYGELKAVVDLAEEIRTKQRHMAGLREEAEEIARQEMTKYSFKNEAERAEFKRTLYTTKLENLKKDKPPPATSVQFENLEWKKQARATIFSIRAEILKHDDRWRTMKFETGYAQVFLIEAATNEVVAQFENGFGKLSAETQWQRWYVPKVIDCTTLQI